MSWGIDGLHPCRRPALDAVLKGLRDYLKEKGAAVDCRIHNYDEEGVMKEEYNFNLTVPLADLDAAIRLLGEARATCPDMRLSRKPDRHGNARFYLCFPYHGARTDLRFMEWFVGRNTRNWELFGPNYGIWGLT